MFSLASRVLSRCRTAAVLTSMIAGCVATGAVAQTIDYPDFIDPSDLRLVGHAAVVGDRLRLAAAANSQTGAYVDRSRAAHWDGRNDVGEHVRSGAYIYRIEAGDYSAVRKMIVLK